MIGLFACGNWGGGGRGVVGSDWLLGKCVELGGF